MFAHPMHRHLVQSDMIQQNFNQKLKLDHKVKVLTKQLIENLQIQQGSQLAKILGVNPIFYNDEALHVWVQRQIDEGLIVDDEAIGVLEAAFIGLMRSYEQVEL